MTKVSNLSDLRTAWNKVHPDMAVGEKAPREERVRKCRICGADMEHIAGSNVFVCHGVVTTKNAKGEEESKPCTNTVISKAV